MAPLFAAALYLDRKGEGKKQEAFMAEYMTDSQGRRVPVELVGEIDKLRDQTVRALFDKALRQKEELEAFKRGVREDVRAFVDISAERYGRKWGGAKGNVSLATYDGELKVALSVSETLAFDERLQIARDIIGRCLDKWSDGARPEIRLLVNDAFKVDKRGEVSTTRILGLRRLRIDDPEWMRAMEAITESIQVAGSKRYLRFYKKNEEGRYENVPLDVAAL
jgi:hypothetical protein